MPLVTSGVEHGNLRELALARMKDLGTECRDVRTREVGIQEIHHKVKPYEVCDTLNCYSLFCDFSHLDLTILTGFSAIFLVIIQALMFLWSKLTQFFDFFEI